MHVVLRNALLTCQSAADARHLTITTALHAGHHLIWADPARIGRFLNLLQNAIKFNVDAGSITIRSSNTEQDTLEIAVTTAARGD